MRIVIDPDHLRHAASTYRPAGRTLDEARARIRTPAPEMPSDLAARARAVVSASVLDLGEQIDYIGHEATALVARAALAEKADNLDSSAPVVQEFDLFSTGGAPELDARFGRPGKPDLDRVLREYQVQDSALRMWPTEGSQQQELTEAEIALLEALPVTQRAALWRLQDLAKRAAQRRDPGPHPEPSYNGTGSEDRGHANAFQHAYWNALITNAHDPFNTYGPDLARKLTTAHESRPGNPATLGAMDLYNNQVGRQIAIAHPDADPPELRRLIDQAIRDGDLIVHDANGRLTWSDRVAVGEHGPAQPATLPGGSPAEGPGAALRRGD